MLRRNLAFCIEKLIKKLSIKRFSNEKINGHRLQRIFYSIAFKLEIVDILQYSWKNSTLYLCVTWDLFTFRLGSFSWLGILSVKALDIENEIMNTVRIILFFTSKDKIISLIWLYFKDRLHLMSINLEEFLNLTLPSHQLPPNFTALVDLPYGKKRLRKKKKMRN